jgi:hypothetical protein
MQIGCKIYTHKQWNDFTDKEIIAMDDKTAMIFWKKNKTCLMSLCKNMAETVKKDE